VLSIVLRTAYFYENAQSVDNNRVFVVRFTKYNSLGGVMAKVRGFKRLYLWWREFDSPTQIVIYCLQYLVEISCIFFLFHFSIWISLCSKNFYYKILKFKIFHQKCFFLGKLSKRNEKKNRRLKPFFHKPISRCWDN
jgi:hypothetical protein